MHTVTDSSETTNNIRRQKPCDCLIRYCWRLYWQYLLPNPNISNWTIWTIRKSVRTCLILFMLTSNFFWRKRIVYVLTLGVPPTDAREFVQWLNQLSSSSSSSFLSHLKYSVLALGDSSYVHFCRAGQTLDNRWTFFLHVGQIYWR